MAGGSESLALPDDEPMPGSGPSPRVFRSNRTTISTGIPAARAIS
jgi:hypothetical protein